jgi:hypothetical protein
MYLNPIKESVPIKDLFITMCNRKKAFVFEINPEKDFFKDILRHEDKLIC